MKILLFILFAIPSISFGAVTTQYSVTSNNGTISLTGNNIVGPTFTSNFTGKVNIIDVALYSPANTWDFTIPITAYVYEQTTGTPSQTANLGTLIATSATSTGNPSMGTTTTTAYANQTQFIFPDMNFVSGTTYQIVFSRATGQSLSFATGATTSQLRWHNAYNTSTAVYVSTTSTTQAGAFVLKYDNSLYVQDGIVTLSSPLENASYSNTFRLTGTYNNGQDEAYTHIQLRLPDWDLYKYYSIVPASVEGGEFDFIVSGLESGQYYAYVSLVIRDTDGNIDAITDEYESGYFTVGLGTNAGSQIDEWLPATCEGIDDILGCLQNAIYWTFVPSPDTLLDYKTLPETMKGIFPFVYFFQIRDIWTEAWDVGTTYTIPNITADTTIGEFTILKSTDFQELATSNVLAIFKTIFGAILLLGSLYYVYSRTLRLIDSH